MILVAIGSTTFMILAKQLAQTDPSSISRTIQGLLSGIGFLGGAVIFKSGGDVRGVKAAAAVWITGAIGLAIGTSFWWLGITVGQSLLSVRGDSSRPDVKEAEKMEGCRRRRRRYWKTNIENEAIASLPSGDCFKGYRLTTLPQRVFMMSRASRPVVPGH